MYKWQLAGRTTREALLVLAALGVGPAATAQTPVEVLHSTAPHEYDFFGHDVDIEGDRLVVGTREVDTFQLPGMAVENAGAAAIHRRDDSGTPADPSDDTWPLEVVLENPFTDKSAFGHSVSIDGQRVLIGAPFARDSAANPAQGRAAIYRHEAGAWVLEDVLTADDPQDGHEFGSFVELQGDYAAVTALYDDQVAALGGAVYVFQRQGHDWVQQAKLHSDPLPPEFAYFGSALALDGDLLVVGAYNETTGAGLGAGATYVFERDAAGTADPADDTWPQRQRLVPADASEFQRFGRAVAADGGLILIGAVWDDDVVEDAGAAYVYERDDQGTPGRPADDEWLFESKLTAAESNVGGSFGRDLDLSGDTTVIASHDNVLPSKDGSVYVFRRAGDAWTRVGDMRVENTKWETAVAFDGATAIVGASSGGPSPASNQVGAVHVFAIEHSPWMWLGAALAGAGGPPTLFGVGTLRPGTAVTLSVTQGPALASAVLVLGGSAVDAPLKGGILVPSPDRLFALPLGAAGEAALELTWPSGVATPSPLFLQVWIADDNGPAGLSATNALSLETV